MFKDLFSNTLSLVFQLILIEKEVGALKIFISLSSSFQNKNTQENKISIVCQISQLSDKYV